MEPSTLLVASLVVLFAINIPVAFAIALSSLVFLVAKGGIPIQTLVQRMVNGTESFPLLAIPFFILAGELMNRAGITRRLFKLASAMVGHITGGLAHVTVVTNTLMAGMSGSSVADAAATAKVLVPAMVSSGYSKTFSAAITASSGTIAPVIPPSIGLVLYGAMTGTSIGRLFLGGFIPGLLMAASLMSFSYVISRRRGYGIRGATFSWRGVAAGLKESFLALLIPVIILGGIGAGVFTATEAAAVAAVYAGVVGIFAYKEISFADLPTILSDAALGTATIGFIMAAATPFGWIMAWERMPQAVASWVVSTTSNPLVILVLLNLFLLILGCFMDGVAIMVITIPTLMPIITRIGVDPVQFGLILIINLMVGGLTPPYGLLLFTVSAITKVPPLEIAREAVPFMGAILVVLLLVTYVPGIVLFLPDLVMGAAK